MKSKNRPNGLPLTLTINVSVAGHKPSGSTSPNGSRPATTTPSAIIKLRLSLPIFSGNDGKWYPPGAALSLRLTLCLEFGGGNRWRIGLHLVTGGWATRGLASSDRANCKKGVLNGCRHIIEFGL
jgi:hypothetical protein